MDRSNAMNHTCFWNSLHLDRTGKTTVCCMPDMARTMLADFSDCKTSKEFQEKVFNSPKIKAMRRKVLAGKRFCKHCTRPLRGWRFQDCDYSDLGEYAPLSMLKHVEILCGTFCNANCMMCEQNHRDKNAIQYDLVKTFMSAIQPENVLLYGGEIFYVPGGKEFLTWCLDQFPQKVEIYTNGNLPEHFAEKLITKALRVAFSILGVHKTTYEAVMGVRWETTQKFLNAALDIRKKDRATAQLVWHFTMTPANAHEVAQALRSAAERGFDVFRASPVMELGYYLVSYPALLYRISRELEEAQGEVGKRLICETDDLQRMFVECQLELQSKTEGKQDPQLFDVKNVKIPIIKKSLRGANRRMRSLASHFKRR